MGALWTIGAGVFAVFAILRQPEETDARIVVTDAQVEWLSQDFARLWNRQPPSLTVNHIYFSSDHGGEQTAPMRNGAECPA